MPSTQQYIAWLQSYDSREPERSMHRLLAARLIADSCLPMYEYASKRRLRRAILRHLSQWHETPELVYKLARLTMKSYRY